MLRTVGVKRLLGDTMMCTMYRNPTNRTVLHCQRTDQAQRAFEPSVCGKTAVRKQPMVA